MTTYLKCRIPNNESTEIVNLTDIPKLTVLDGITIENSIDKEDSYIKLNGRTYQKNLLFLESEILFNRARKLWKTVESMIINDKLLPQTCLSDLKEIENLLLYTAQNLASSRDTEGKWKIQKGAKEFVSVFKNSISEFANWSDIVIGKLSSNAVTLGTESISHYFHSYLSINYIILNIESFCDITRFDENVKTLMQDLILLANKIYERNKDSVSQPFSCLCVKKLWLYFVQYYNRQETNKFWNIFNDVIPKGNDEFTIWFLYHIALLHLYNDSGILIGQSIINTDNYDLLAKSLQSLTFSPINTDRKLLDVLKFVHALLANVWNKTPKLEPYQILWEYFYKNLDSTYIGEIPIPKNVKDFMDLMNRIQKNPKELETSYEYYLHMLCQHLDRNPQHWTKMRGRIYSRIPLQKMNTFKSKAIFQISVLFLMLAHANVGEAIDKLNDLLESLNAEKRDSEMVWITYIAMMILSIRQNQDIRKISTGLRNSIEELSSNRSKYHILKHYIVGLDIIMNNNQNYNLGQSSLLGPWITPYMNNCAHTDLCQLLDNLTCSIIQVENCGMWYEFKNSYTEFVLPALKKVAISNSAPPQVGELVAKICLNVPEIAQPTMQYFCNNSVNIKVTYQFLSTILGNKRLVNYTVGEENLLISSWFRICAISTDKTHKDLAENIFKLSQIRTILTVENYEDDPYTAFVLAINNQMERQMNINKLKDLCEVCFGNIDQWLLGYLTPYTPDHQIIYLYTTISLFFYYCSPLLYHKSKSICLFTRLISLMLLPIEILMGKTPPANALKAIEKTWHLFIKGVYKLGHTTDPYIDRTLKDLVVRFIPHFSQINSPLLKILDDNAISSVVFEKISNAFLFKSARSSEENTFKAIKTLQIILENTHDEQKIFVIMEKILLGVLEVIMFNNQKSIALELIKSVISAGWYNQLQAKIQNAIQNVTERHLAFNTTNYFQLISNLINIVPSSIRTTLPYIKKEITRLECKRGVGHDVTLREGLNRIEKALS